MGSLSETVKGKTIHDLDRRALSLVIFAASIGALSSTIVLACSSSAHPPTTGDCLTPCSMTDAGTSSPPCDRDGGAGRRRRRWCSRPMHPLLRLPRYDLHIGARLSVHLVRAVHRSLRHAHARREGVLAVVVRSGQAQHRGQDAHLRARLGQVWPRRVRRALNERRRSRYASDPDERANGPGDADEDRRDTCYLHDPRRDRR